MNIVEAIAKFVRICPHENAFVEVRPVTGGRKEATWAQFDERTNRLAHSLINEGAGKGEKVFLLGRNSINWLEVYFAVLKTGAWIAPLNFRFTDDDIRYCANVAEPAIFILDEEYATRVDGLRSGLPTVKHYHVIGSDVTGGMEPLEDLVNKGSPMPMDTGPANEDECALYFTSGTTGAPKPVLLQHKSLMCISITEAANHNFTASDRFLMMPPLYHLAIGHMLGVMIAGGCTVLLIEQISPKNIIETMAKERLTTAFLLVPWAIDLVEALDKGEISIKDYDLSNWRLIFTGAQPVPPSLVRRLKGYFPEITYGTTYGLSEGSGPGIIHLGVVEDKHVGAIGKPSLMWDARIVNDNGEDVKQGEVGELIVKGEGVMKGYYKNPELTSRVISNGWLHTGDLSKADEEGFIYIVDRKKDLIITGGENIYPGEVEETILRHPKVHDVAVIGSPDDRLGEIVCAVIEPLAGETLSEEEVGKYCEEHLPRYKRPRRIIFDHVPRNPTGKLEKPKLRAKYAGKN
ncbi:MAG: Long-chain-fatty-acid--CoA ligase FadD13 [Syntrophorhabdus sp. PtaU1.Bin058]|nr:MAG: Long-chain-fatty-acid--CoA ligase FadD13 [Syntrophorhabdus sp. PtaU1.Bin058]